MNRVFAGSLIFFAFLTSSGNAQSARPAESLPNQTLNAGQAADVPFVSKTLANGLEVIVLPDPSVPLVTVELAVRNGSFTEPPELNGLSHLYEHMFFKSNEAILLLQCDILLSSGRTNPRCGDAIRLRPRLGDVSYLRNIDSLGLTYNGSTREEVVNYYYTTTSPYLSTAIRVINDSVRFPLFDETEFDNEKRIVIGEVDRNEANPYFYLNRSMMDKLFYKYPTRKNALGSRDSINTSTTEKMRLIKDRYYVPNNAALVVTGDVSSEEVFKLAERTLGSWERRAVDPFKEFPLVEHPPLTKSEAVFIEKQTGEETQNSDQNVLLQIGWHGPSIGKDDRGTYAADVFSYILTQPNSRFQRNLVDTGLASAATIGYYTQRNVGPIMIFLITTPEKVKAALEAVYAEVGQFGSPAYFTAEELESSKTILEAQDLFEREKPSEYAHTLGFWWSSTGIEYFRGYHKNLNAVSRADINQYVNTYIIGKPRIGIALLSPEAKKLANITDVDLIGGKQ
ncbi:MAG: pitrilysin family protein [Pyrinomonadaceae bacterium]